MTCEELKLLIPDMVDGSLPADVLAEAQEALDKCPDCQRELEIARQVRAFMVRLQAENLQFQLPAGFETRLLERVRRQSGSVDLVDLSSKVFAIWLIELTNLIGGLLDPRANARRAQPRQGTA
ncbi:MAG TPA: zf-HC2 domain-containing protein [Chloroflexia bacterium]|nr:zf-HC2 domain-containing protein [Chloroflexia bacterium]